MYIFLISFIISLSINIIVIYLSNRYNIFIDRSYSDKPQNFHCNCTSRAGGFGIIFGLLIITYYNIGLQLLVAMILAFLSGIIEDYSNSLGPKIRLFMQFVASLVAVLLLDAIVRYLGLGIYLPYLVGVFFTTFAIVGMMNAINMIDGFNGLASGIALMILLSFVVVANSLGIDEILTVIYATIGATFGFFVLNFPKGKIFLGDGGAYLLGFMLAIIGIFLASKYDAVSPWYILSVFIYPVWEVIFSIIRKKAMGKSPLIPDSLHFHMLVYRVLAKKSNPLTSIYILLFVAPFIVISTLFPNNSMLNLKVVLIFIVFYLLLYFWLYKRDK